jgi:hypothetical protein
MRSADLSRAGTIVLASALVLAAVAASAETLVPAKGPIGVQGVAKRARKAPEPPKVSETPEMVPLKPSGDGDFTYALKNVVKAKSSEFCERYNAGADCIQDIEICLSMLDRDEDSVRVCVTVVPADENKPRAASAKR